MTHGLHRTSQAAAAPRLRACLFTVRAAASGLLLAALAGCGGHGSSSGGEAPPPPAFVISGTVSHLNTAGLSLMDGGETITVAAGATTFAFKTPVANGTAYAVSVASQPAGRTCAVTNGSGTISGAEVASIGVACSTVIAAPSAVGVVPFGSTSSNNSRIFLPITMVGDTPVAINSVLDTGSAGLVLNAFLVFPSTMVTSSGFIFPAGQDTLTYNGITVTKARYTKSFGAQTADPTVDTGNLGFAQLTFGSGTQVTTKVVPILFVYQLTSNGAPAPAANIPNFFGVNAELGTINALQGAADTATSPPPCTVSSTATCGIASPLRYLTYATGVNAGFAIDRIMLNDCSMAAAGSCPTQNALTLGLDATAGAGFRTVKLSCRIVTGGDFQNEQFCSQTSAGVTVASDGASFTGPAIFDSGVPMVRLSVPPGSSFVTSLSDGSTVQVTPPNGAPYNFTTGTGYLRTVVVQATNATEVSNFGIAFFTKNAFLLSYANGLQGWR